MPKLLQEIMKYRIVFVLILLAGMAILIYGIAVNGDPKAIASHTEIRTPNNPGFYWILSGLFAIVFGTCGVVHYIIENKN